MRIVILAIGSRGDVQPYVALGQGLYRTGHEVRIAAHHLFEPLIRSYGLDFAPVAGPPDDMFRSEAGRSWLATGTNYVSFMRHMLRTLRPVVQQLLADCVAACQDADAIIFSPLGFAGYHIAEHLRVPAYAAMLQPGVRSRAFSSAFAPFRLPLGGVYNWTTHLVVEQLSWQAVRRGVNAWRQTALDLAPLPFRGPFRRWQEQALPFLLGYSPTIVPKPHDWPASVHVTGYWFLDKPAHWQPPASLVAFLDDGPPPIYIGFGSMASRSALDTAMVALEQTTQRGVLLSNGADIQPSDVPESVRLVEDVPHDWLFPRMAAVVHHGGAGTTAAGLRAGVPSSIVPFFADQFFWGQRVAALGAGPRPLPHKQLAPEQLAQAIQTCLTEPGVRQRAAAISRQLRQEDGVGHAVQAFHRHLPQRAMTQV